MSSGRHLLVIATAHYGPDTWDDLEGVDDETRVWTDWLTDPGLGERAFTLVFKDLARSPGKKRINEVLEERGGFNRYRDVLVCYITGHGERHNREHRLVLSTSLPGEPSSMLPTRQVLEWAIDRVDTALVVVDTCHAGDIANYLASLDKDLPPGWVVIASASTHETAHLGVLTKAVREFAETGADQDAQPYLDFYDLIPALADALDDQNWHPFGKFPPRSRSRLITLPNRHYRPDVNERVPLEAPRQDVAMYLSDLTAHWNPRGRGVGDASTPGMLFTGRNLLMRTLVAAAQGEPGALVVTGSAGCGKSAVLSRLVTFSDGGFRTRYADASSAAETSGEPLPDIGDVDVAVLAKGSVAEGVLGAIRDRLGIPLIDGETISNTITRIHQARNDGRQVTLVVDALDEAEDPRGIVNSVLAPLVNAPDAPWLRLLIGVRGNAPTTADAHAVEDALAAATVRALSATAVDAAAPPYWTEGDLVAYVARLLRTPIDNEQPTPYDTAGDDQVLALASTVAEIAGTSYVLARLIGDQLRRQSRPQDPTDPAWQARSRAGLAQILTAELQQDYPDPDRRRVARCLLTAAALARGRGAPRRKVWPTIAQALDPTGRRYTDTDIATLLDEHIGGYLVRDTADNATVYRPFHDALAEALTSSLGQDSRRRVTADLLELFTVIRSHGLVVPPEEYLRRHAVEHAADSGGLDRVIQYPDVLTWTNPDHLIPLLGTLQDPEAQAIGPIYRTVAHTLRQPDRPPDTFVLQLRVRQAGLNELADGLAGAAPTPTASPRWATPRRDSDHHRIDTAGGNSDALAMTTLPDGTPVIVSGSRDGTVRVWRLADGTPVGGPLRGHSSSVTAVTSVAVGELPDGTPVIVSGSTDGAVRVWRLADGTPVGEPMRGRNSVTSVAVGELPDGAPVIVSGSRDGAVRVWRLADGTPVGEPLRGHSSSVTSVAVGALHDGAPVIVSGSRDNTVRVWRLADGMPLGEPLRGHDDAVASVAIGALPDGAPVIVSGSRDETVRVWRLADGMPLGEPLRGHDDAVASVAIGALPYGAPAIVSGSRDGTVRVWRLSGGSPVGGPLRGHDDAVTSVAVGALPDGTPVIVSGSNDRTVRVWRLPDGTAVGGPLRGHSGSVASMAIGELPDGTPVVVSGGNDRTVRVWRLTDGAAVGGPLRGHSGSVASVAIGELPDGTPVIVSGSNDTTIRVWKLADDTSSETGWRRLLKAARVRLLPGRTSVGELLRGTPVGELMLGTVVVELLRGTPVGRLLSGHTNMVTSVAVGELPDGTSVIVSGSNDGTVRVWRLPGGTPVGGPLRGHNKTVASVAVGELPDGTSVIVSGSNDGTVRVWRLTDGTAVGGPLRGHSSSVTAVAVGALPDGAPVVLSGSNDETVRVWRLPGGTPVGEPLRGHNNAVTSVAVGELADGTPVVISGSNDGTVRVRRLPGGTPVGCPLNMQSPVTAIAVTGAIIVAAMDNDIVAIELNQ